MLRETPNLDWLRVFAETAATESFALAASRLGVTPGAVSQRIKALEAFLRIDLFQRYPQGVKLTEAGKRYAQRVSPALEQLTIATREIISPASAKSVRVTILPSLAQLWLGAKMEEFHALETSTTVEIWADPTIIDLRASNFDVAIRYGNPPFPGCDYRPILFDELVPVASPGLIENAGFDERGLPVGAPLMIDPYWESDFAYWLDQTGQASPRGLNIQTINLYSMVVDATLKGRGFMIGHTALIGDLIEEGQLQTLSDKRVPSKHQFYLLTKAGVPMNDATGAFVDWIMARASGAAKP